MATPRTHLPILGTVRLPAERQATYETRALTSGKGGAFDGAVCAAPGVDPEVFFPESGDSRSAGIAFRLCSRCPARPACLRDALASGDRHGIRGGFGPVERAEILASVAPLISGTTRHGKKGVAA